MVYFTGEKFESNMDDDRGVAEIFFGHTISWGLVNVPTIGDFHGLMMVNDGQ